MTKYAMTIDLNKCVGCRACVIACKAEWGLDDDKSRCWVTPVGPEVTEDGMTSTFYTGLCNHCDSPSCIDECPTSATYKKADGTVAVDKELCIGCGNCVLACPYGARYTSGHDKKVDKCSFCDTRVAGGLLPACVVTCPTEARLFGDIEDQQSSIYKQVFNHDAYPLASKKFNLGPNVYYVGQEKDIKLLLKRHLPSAQRVSETNLAWRNLKPMISGSLGLTSLGVISAFLGQLFLGEEDEHE